MQREVRRRVGLFFFPQSQPTSVLSKINLINYMKRLSTTASLIVTSLIEKVQEKEFDDILLPDQPILNINRFETVAHPDGTGFLLSVGLFADKFRLRYITRVISLVIDQRAGDKNTACAVKVIPFYYADDPNEIIEVAAVFSNGTLTLTDELKQRDICSFMERWLVDLRTDGYV